TDELSLRASLHEAEASEEAGAPLVRGEVARADRLDAEPLEGVRDRGHERLRHVALTLEAPVESVAEATLARRDLREVARPRDLVAREENELHGDPRRVLA